MTITNRKKNPSTDLDAIGPSPRVLQTDGDVVLVRTGPDEALWADVVAVNMAARALNERLRRMVKCR